MNGGGAPRGGHLPGAGASPGALSVLVVGVVRDVEGCLRRDVFRLREALSGFGRVDWFLVESDSVDGTTQVLNALAGRIPGFRFVSLGSLRARYPLRTERIAFCRNVYLKELRENPSYRDVDLLLVADFDGINQLICRRSIESCFVRDDWDVCTANQRGRYYDVWALRHDPWCPNDCWRQAEFLERHGLSRGQARFAAVYAKMLVIPPDAPWLEVESAFGGLAIYRRRVLAVGDYEGVARTGGEICEHVVFHRRLRDRGARIFINPAMINAASTEHTRHFSPARRVTRAVQAVARRCAGWLAG